METNSLKNMVEKSYAYDSLAESVEAMRIHSRGFAYDSLIYRFKDYQSRAFQAEVIDYKYHNNCSEIEARNKIQDRHNRDLMRFIQILDEVIGEHD